MQDTLLVRCELCPIRRMSLFKPLTPGELAFVAAMKVGQIVAHPGSDIIPSGDARPALYTLFEGWALRYRDYGRGPGERQVLDILLPGDLIGLSGTLIGPGRHAVKALTSVSLCVLDHRRFLTLFDTQPALARSLFETQLWRERQADERLGLLGQRNGAQRHGFLMLEIFDRLHSRGMTSATGCPFPLQRRHLAATLGMSGTHVARSLAELRAAGLATITNGMLQIHDRAALASFCGYEPAPRLGIAALL